MELAIQLARECPCADQGEGGLLDVVGVDIGTVNLALCRLRMIGGKPVVVWWAVIDLLGLERGIARDACAAVPRCLAPYLPCFADCPFFAIEQQPNFGYNEAMRMLSHALITYFHTINPQCETYMSAAQNKLKPFEEAQVESYSERKASAELIVAKLLNEAVRDQVQPERHLLFAKWFAALKKRDDAADAFLYAYYGLLLRQKPVKKKAATVGSLTVKQLKEQLKEKSLPFSGTKRQLADRLRQAKAQEVGRTSMTVPQLRQELAARGLDCAGSKTELAKRLFAAQALDKPKRKRRDREASPKKTLSI